MRPLPLTEAVTSHDSAPRIIGSTKRPARLCEREFELMLNPFEHAMTAMPRVTRPMYRTATALGLLIDAFVAVTAN
jgi:hypothetical protein